ncbi:ABC transporter C family member 3 [Glycine max]|nr:ABC transporter C family member 3 [Glycine max]
MSRSSTDQSTPDTYIPYRLEGLVFALIQLLSIIVLMSQVAWQVILLFFVVLAISIWLGGYGSYLWFELECPSGLKAVDNDRVLVLDEGLAMLCCNSISLQTQLR